MFRTRVLLALLSTMPMTALVSAQALPKAVPGTPAATPATPETTEAKPSRFDEIDTNHDGFISRDEFLTAEKKRFDEFDTNHDGKIDAKEIASSPPLMERNIRTAERMVKQWDADGNGIVTAEEYKKSAEERFAKQDKDGTGKLTRKTPAGMQRMMMPPPTAAQPPKPAPPAPTKP